MIREQDAPLPDRVVVALKQHSYALHLAAVVGGVCLTLAVGIGLAFVIPLAIRAMWAAWHAAWWIW
jgi:hypothetical protein